MAKKKKRKTSRGTLAWAPGPNNAIELAALHWYSLAMAQKAIEIYATSPARFAQLSQLCRRQIRELEAFAEQSMEAEDCPPGYELCRNGICAPMCDEFTSEE